MTRQLLNDPVAADAPPQVIVVRNPAQLQYALQGGYRDIEIRSHMDISPLTSRLLAAVFSSTRSIRGRCSESPASVFNGTKITGEKLGTIPKDGCVLLSDADVLSVQAGPVWLDNLYFRHNVPDHVSLYGGHTALVSVSGEGEIYATNSVFQGNGAARLLGLKVQQGGQLFGSGLKFSNLCGAPSAAIAVAGPGSASAQLQSSEFSGTHKCPTLTDGAAKGVDTTLVSIHAEHPGAIVYTKDCKLSVGGKTPLWASKGAKMYSSPSVGVGGGASGFSTAAALPATMAASFLSENDQWFAAAQQALKNIPSSAYSDAPELGGGPPTHSHLFSSQHNTPEPPAKISKLSSSVDSSSSSQPLALVGAAAASFLILICCLVVCWIRRKPRVERNAIPKDTPISTPRESMVSQQ